MKWIKADQIFQKIAAAGISVVALLRIMHFVSLELSAIGIMLLLLFAWAVSTRANKALKRRVLELEQQPKVVN